MSFTDEVQVLFVQNVVLGFFSSTLLPLLTPFTFALFCILVLFILVYNEAIADFTLGVFIIVIFLFARVVQVDILGARRNGLSLLVELLFVLLAAGDIGGVVEELGHG